MRSSSWLGVILASASFFCTHMACADEAQIVVTGSGSVVVSPNRARVDVLVTATAATTKEAAAQNARTVKMVLDALRQMGISDADIRTAGFAVRTERDNKTGKPTGQYVSSHRIRVQTTDLDNIGPIVDAVVAQGAELGSITFTATEVDHARQQALAEAFTQAHSDAEAMATAAGGKLGPLIELTTQGSARPPHVEGMALMAGGMEAQTLITPAEQYVNVTLLCRWEFRESK